jgi:hypothetical protein
MMSDPCKFNPDDPRTWPCFKPLIIAHDVGRSRDRSTAVVGGNCPLGPRVLGIVESEELPQGLFGSARASALAVIDRRHQSNGLIVADLSTDASYAEVLHATFGRRVIGLQISRSGDGMNAELRAVNNSAMPVYTIGRTFLFELLHSELQSDLVRSADGPDSRRAFAQLEALETELRDSGIVYKCLPGQHDDLAISWAMLAWAARHRHLDSWVGTALAACRPRRPRQQQFDWRAFT